MLAAANTVVGRESPRGCGAGGSPIGVTCGGKEVAVWEMVMAFAVAGVFAATWELGDEGGCLVCPGVMKFPFQLPKTLTIVTISFAPCVRLLFTKSTKFAIIFALPVVMLVFPPVLKFAWLPPVFAERSRTFCTVALLD